MIERKLQKVITDRMFKGKAIIVLGARQTGKTTLLKQIVEGANQPVLWLDAEEPIVRSQLASANIPELKRLIGKNRIVVIDEAQLIPDVGHTLKLITDHLNEVQLLVSGSSALELSSATAEPLTGRKYEFYLYPVSYMELCDHHGWFEEKRLLKQRLVFGSYPEIATAEGDAGELLGLLAGSYLFKDIFKFKDLRRPELLETLLQSLALQTGSQVSYNELAQTIGADIETVQRYIELLEKTYVIFRLRSFSRNLRNELKKSRKIYFFDNGILNALINNFSSLELRNDVGVLWENYLVSERMKFLAYNQIPGSRYFWRTQQQQEIDYIEERNGKIYAFEFKWKGKPGLKAPITFAKAYPEHEFQMVTPDSVDQFIGSADGQ